MDLLGDVAEEGRDAHQARGLGPGKFARGQAPTVLLARLPAPLRCHEELSRRRHKRRPPRRKVVFCSRRRRVMERPMMLFALGSLLASPAQAAPGKMNPEKMKQISEVVFENYPPRALRNGEQGSVYFTVTLDKDAHPTACQVTYGSGHPLLDQETCDLIVQHAVFNSVKDKNGHATKSTHEGVVNWRIPGMAPPPV